MRIYEHQLNPWPADGTSPSEELIKLPVAARILELRSDGPRAWLVVQHESDEWDEPRRIRYVRKWENFDLDLLQYLGSACGRIESVYVFEDVRVREG